MRVVLNLRDISPQTNLDHSVAITGFVCENGLFYVCRIIPLTEGCFLLGTGGSESIHRPYSPKVSVREGTSPLERSKRGGGETPAHRKSYAVGGLNFFAAQPIVPTTASPPKMVCNHSIHISSSHPFDFASITVAVSTTPQKRGDQRRGKVDFSQVRRLVINIYYIISDIPEPFITERYPFFFFLASF